LPVDAGIHGRVTTAEVHMRRMLRNAFLLGGLVLLAGASMGGCTDTVADFLHSIAGDIDNIADDLVDDEDNHSILDIFGQDDD